MSEIKTLNGYALADEKARKTDPTLTVEGMAADAKAVGDALANTVHITGQTLTPEQQAQVRKNIGAAKSYEFSESGNYVDISNVNDVELNATTTFDTNFIHADLILTQAIGPNLFDMADVCGGVGKTITQDGITCEIVEGGMLEITGTNTNYTNPSFNVDVYASGLAYIVFPPGRYTLGDSYLDRCCMYVTLVNAETYTYIGAINGFDKGVEINEPFMISGITVVVYPYTYNGVRIPMSFVRGSSSPETGKFEGTHYKATFVNTPTAGQTFNWATGVLYDAEGNVVEQIAGFPIYGQGGTNTLFCGLGETTVSGERIADVTAITETAFNPSVWGLPVLKLTGDASEISKDNAVTLSYTYGDRFGTCEVKWQGSSSLYWPKKNYTIKFDNAFEAAEGWGEQTKYCFKANHIDHTHSRNVVSCKLWGQIVKSRTTANATLNALPNGGAIDGFPTIITLNGEFHGLYTWNIPKDGWMFGMGSGTQEAILCAHEWGDGTAFKAPVDLSNDFVLEYVSDESNSAWVAESVNRLINACIDSDGTDLDTTIAQYLDWDSAIDYYIYNVLEDGSDATGRNYLLATYDGVKWFFSAYDRDTIYGLDWDGKTFRSAVQSTTFATFASGHRVMYLIHTYKKAALLSRYRQLRETVMAEWNVAKTFENFAAVIPSTVLMEDVKKWPTIPSSFVNNIGQILNWYRMRVEKIDKEIESLSN